jgi:drug/metabolite transporter (DMT)-like permease
VSDAEIGAGDAVAFRLAVATSPPPRDLGILFVGVLCGATAPPLMAAAAVPALAIAFWRNALSLVVLLPLALLRSRSELRSVSRRLVVLIAVAAVLLAVHFGGMASALQYTSVASAAALVCSQSMWAAIFARMLGQRMQAVAWLGTALALLGVIVVTGVDLSLSGRALVGDALALLAGLAGGAYMVVGGVVRQHLTVIAYTAVCYSVCAVVLLVAVLMSGQALWGYSTLAWTQLAALTVLVQLVGHSIFNLVMRSVSPSLVSLGQLLTMPLSAVLAALALEETPPIEAVPALALMLIGTGIVVTSSRRSVLAAEGP